MNILNIGSVAFDSIKSPFGNVDRVLGGSATYFSLAASFFAKPSVIAVVGNDFNKNYGQVFKKKKIDISGLEKKNGKTFAWGGEYNFNLSDRKTNFTHLNVFENFTPKLTEDHKRIPYVFLGNIQPALQLEVLNQIKNPKFVGLDTMNLWIEKNPRDLTRVIKKINAFIINEGETRELTKEYNLLKAAKKILGMMDKNKKPVLIIKQGEYGLLMFTQDDHNRRLSIFNLPGYLLETVFDPTGAGDSFAGGFMGYLASCNKLDEHHLKRACVYGSVVASFCVEDFGTKKLEKLTLKEIQNRFSEFKNLTHFEIK